MKDKIKVLIADDHAMVRMGLASLLETEPDIEVIGEAENGETAVSKALSLKPDVIVTETLALAAMERSGEVHTLRYETSTGKFEVLSTLGNLFRPVALTTAP